MCYTFLPFRVGIPRRPEPAPGSPSGPKNSLGIVNCFDLLKLLDSDSDRTLALCEERRRIRLEGCRDPSSSERPGLMLDTEGGKVY
jgi:hypothetical protein